jgi:hypothetical protein
MQYSEGQEVTIYAHNQQATYPIRYTDEQKVMGFANHMGGVRWKILAIMWCRKSNLISKAAGEPVFLLWSEHITEWAQYEATEETLVDVTYPRWRFVPESRIKAITTTPMVELSESQRVIKDLELRGTEPDPMDPKAPEIWAKQKKARDLLRSGSPKSEAPAPPSSSQLKRKSGNTPRGNPPKVVKKGKNDSPAPIPKEDRIELNNMKEKLRETELLLKSARDRMRRLEGKEENMNKFYEELRNKTDEFAEEFDGMKELKVATFNHFLSKWENVNETNQGDDITELRLAIPLSLRKYFSEEIKKMKDSLK